MPQATDMAVSQSPPYYPPTNLDRLQELLMSDTAKKLGVWAAFFLIVSRLKSFYGEIVHLRHTLTAQQQVCLT